MSKQPQKTNTKKGLHKLADELVVRVQTLANGGNPDVADEAPGEDLLSEDEARALVLNHLRRRLDAIAEEVAAKLA